MKKTFVGAVAALLFMFCFSLHPVSAQAAEHMLQMENDEWVCYTAGQRDNSYTGMAVNEYGWWYLTDGEIDRDYTGMACNEYGWWYMNNGALDLSYTGIADVNGEPWYVVNGTIDFSYNGMVNASGSWWYLNQNKVDTDFTGLALNEYGWWYINAGEIDFSYTGLGYNEYGWWYVDNGTVDLSYTGMAQLGYDWWYVTNGVLDRDYTGMTVYDGNWYYLINGFLDRSYEGLADNEYGWWYISNGTIDFTYNGMAANEYGWWYVSSGGVDGTFTGVASNSYGSWYFENGTINYNYDGEYTYVGITYIVKNGLATPLQKSSVGIDVSKHNGEIDWDAVKADGIKFAIIRVGYGNDDTDQDDVWAVRNMQECERVGIPYGVYLYSYAVNEDEANSEANHILRMLQGFNPVLGVYIDIEDTEYYNKYDIDPYSSEGRELITRIAVTVMDRVSRAGYTAGVYANWNYFQNVLIQSEIQAYKWLAWYKEDTSEVPEGDWIMWQYTSTGHVNGIEGNVDMNFWYGF